jgi:hypothetical protein
MELALVLFTVVEEERLAVFVIYLLVKTLKPRFD